MIDRVALDGIGVLDRGADAAQRGIDRMRQRMDSRRLEIAAYDQRATASARRSPATLSNQSAGTVAGGWTGAAPTSTPSDEANANANPSIALEANGRRWSAAAPSQDGVLSTA